MKRMELLVNTQCEGGVTLCRVRGNSNAKSFKFSNAKLRTLTKNDGVLIEVETAVEKGNYIVPVNYKIIETHVSGNPFDLDSLDSEEKALF